MNFKKSLLICFLLLIVISFIIIKPKAISSNNDSFLQDAKSGCLIECKTKKLIYGKNQNERLAPASMTKIMTMI